MQILKIVIGSITAIGVALYIFMTLRWRIISRRISQKRMDRIRPLIDKLESGEEVTSGEVLPFASNVLTRESAYHALEAHGKVQLFPDEFKTLLHAAESNLANWLEFPNELDACPDEIVHIKRHTFDGHHYEVFKYRVNEPNWAAGNGWMIGVVGPYTDESQPYDFPASTFSRIGKDSDPDVEAKWVHENFTVRRG